MVGLCDMCQIVLCHGTPSHNEATTLDSNGRKYVFCSAPCRWIFEQETEKYAGHKNIVSRILAGEAPANLIALLQRYFDLTPSSWGRDCYGGDYPWLKRSPKTRHAGGQTGARQEPPSPAAPATSPTREER
jgi:toluene monooxygenase system protein A